MKPNIIHSIAVCLAAFALSFMVACSSREDSLPDNATEAALYLNIKQIGLSRSGNSELSDNEKMHSVRVVVLHEDKTVEHNLHISTDGVQESKYILLKVTPNEKKHIYLFANEESVSAVEGAGAENESLSAFFDSYNVEDEGFEDAVNKLYFAPDYSDGKPIPMSSTYEIDFPAKGNFDGTFYVVRVATKFTVNFMNWRGENVNVNNLTIAKHADKNFLMGKVGSYPQPQIYPTWIDWLKAVSEASNVNSDEATNSFGWLTDYELPENANKELTYSHGEFTIPAATIAKVNSENTKPGELQTVFYLPESKNLKAEATDGEQEYTMTLDIDGKSEPVELKLANLKALFRNTHVVVNITLYHNLELSVDVIPFSEVEIKPDFGLEREDFTGYIVGKDSFGNKCWFDNGKGPYYLGPNDAKEKFVKIKEKEYLLVYTDVNRTAATLNHIYEKETGKKYLLTPVAITGYTAGNNIYFNHLNQSIWLDDEFLLKCCRTLNEWDRYEWDRARWWGNTGLYPKYWFDIFGKRYPWSQGSTREDRIAIIGEEWVKYLE